MTIDLQKHAVIEASAGTGKTFTIEEIVVRLIVERQVELPSILIVTFTEKATADLRHRLRARLAKESAQRPELRPALEGFDQASIFTIHGFCHRVLQEYPLEQSADFSPAIVDDASLLQTLLPGVQRKRWREHFGEHLEHVLQRAGFDRDSADAWNANVLRAAGEYLPSAGHELHPNPPSEWWKTPSASPDAEDAPSPADQASNHLVVETVRWLIEELQTIKRERGLVSFNDMIARVDECLDAERHPERAPTLLALLRERFPFAIVDEFQDTDPVQWRILSRIFLHEPRRMFVVGDPKQAIFEFRGGDLPTFLAATRQLKSEHGAEQKFLATNWRSVPELIESLNLLFGDGDWFPPAEGIEYKAVESPPVDQRRYRLERNDSVIPAALIGVDLGKPDSPKPPMVAFHRFVAAEIDRLLSGPTLPWSKDGRPARPLLANDICVLVHKRAEADGLCEQLARRGIPFAFYKKTGLWSSEEAVALTALLKTLRTPDDPTAFRRALLTPFFRYAPAQLAEAGEFAATHLARRLYVRWLRFAERRQWSSLFQSLFEETGVLALDADSDSVEHHAKGDVERRAANFRFLAGQLENAGHGDNLDLSQLLAWIEKRGTTGVAGSEGDLQPKATDEPRVQIMTIHASKGLEFPVVFLAGGFSRRPISQSSQPGAYLVARGEKGQRVFRFGFGKAGVEQKKAEQAAEDRRLLYVALTRAIFKLYVPLVDMPKKSGHYAGPAYTILGAAWRAAGLPDSAGAGFAMLTPADQPSFHARATAKAPGQSSAAPMSAPAPAPMGAPAPAVSSPIFPRTEEALGHRRVLVRSYSSIHRQHVAQVGERTRYAETSRPNPDENPERPVDNEWLRGAAFGDAVHKIFESIDFAHVRESASPEQMIERFADTKSLHVNCLKTLEGPGPDADAWLPEAVAQVARMVWNTLRTPLADAGVRLCDVSLSDRLHELEFFFPEVRAPRRDQDRYLGGVIDLVFRVADRYYLLDWKTNLLAGYDPDRLAQAMDLADYHRQYRLYLLALDRWAASRRPTGKDARPSRGNKPGLNVVGVYYLFLRGMNGNDESSGVFFHRPDAADIRLENIVPE